MEERVTATPEAKKAIERLKAKIGPIMFYHSGGCFDGSLPICFRLGEFITGDNDILLGRIDGTPVYIDKSQHEVWKNNQLVLDVASGEPEIFSIAAGDHLRFVTRSRTIRLDFALG